MSNTTKSVKSPTQSRPSVTTVHVSNADISKMIDKNERENFAAIMEKAESLAAKLFNENTFSQVMQTSWNGVKNHIDEIATLQDCNDIGIAFFGRDKKAIIGWRGDQIFNLSLRDAVRWLHGMGQMEALHEGTDGPLMQCEDAMTLFMERVLAAMPE